MFTNIEIENCVNDANRVRKQLGFTILTSALLSKFVAELNLNGILIFEFQRVPFSNNLFNEYYILDNEHKTAPNLFE